MVMDEGLLRRRFVYGLGIEHRDRQGVVVEVFLCHGLHLLRGHGADLLKDPVEHIIYEAASLWAEKVRWSPDEDYSGKPPCV